MGRIGNRRCRYRWLIGDDRGLVIAQRIGMIHSWRRHIRLRRRFGRTVNRRGYGRSATRCRFTHIGLRPAVPETPGRPSSSSVQSDCPECWKTPRTGAKLMSGQPSKRKDRGDRSVHYFNWFAGNRQFVGLSRSTLDPSGSPLTQPLCSKLVKYLVWANQVALLCTKLSGWVKYQDYTTYSWRPTLGALANWTNSRRQV